jgi:hypothetical protein
MEPPALAARPTTLSLDELADACLQHLIENPEQLAEFMVQSGLSPANLRGLVGTVGFKHGLIDYVASNEPLLLAVATGAKVSPEAFMRAWAKLHHKES